MGLQTERGFLTAAGEREARAEAARGIGKVLETVSEGRCPQNKPRRRAHVPLRKGSTEAAQSRGGPLTLT